MLGEPRLLPKMVEKRSGEVDEESAGWLLVQTAQGGCFSQSGVSQLVISLKQNGDYNPCLFLQGCVGIE